MDYADKAAPNIENTIADGLAECRRSKALLEVGACHWCGEACRGIFCCIECRDDYGHEQARRKAMGK